MKYIIREIKKDDDLIIEKIIRDCLIEYHADHDGTAWADPNLNRFSEIYNTDGNKYWVALLDNKIVGGVGIGKLTDDICELQKMYLVKSARGEGIAQQLIDTALSYAKKYYHQCYLETLDNMISAQHFYEKNGFKRIKEPVIKTEHYACDVRYIKNL